MIIEWPLKWQFHGIVIDVLTSRMAISEVVENDGNVVNVIYPLKMVKILLNSSYPVQTCTIRKGALKFATQISPLLNFNFINFGHIHTLWFVVVKIFI